MMKKDALKTDCSETAPDLSSALGLEKDGFQKFIAKRDQLLEKRDEAERERILRSLQENKALAWAE